MLLLFLLFVHICVRLVNGFLHFLFVSIIHLQFSLCYGGIVYEYILVN